MVVRKSQIFIAHEIMKFKKIIIKTYQLVKMVYKVDQLGLCCCSWSEKAGFFSRIHFVSV